MTRKKNSTPKEKKPAQTKKGSQKKSSTAKRSPQKGGAERSRSQGSQSAVPSGWQLVMDADTVSRCISRLSYEILERDRDLEKLALIGIRTFGEVLAQRIQKKIKEIEGVEVPLGILDITLYRDDLSHSRAQPTLRGTDLPFNVSGSRIVLVDDILFTGRTIRAALDAIIDFGRPGIVELAVLLDRGHRELPIRADYVGKNIPSSKNDMYKVKLSEFTRQEDGVYLVPGGMKK